MRGHPEVVIVGGGVIGCAVAMELSRAGARVTLLERRELAHGASGRNHGLIFYPQNPVTDPLYRTSSRVYGEIAQASSIEISLDPTPQGFVILVASDDEWGPAEAEAKSCEQGGVKIERWDQAELREAEPNVSERMLGGWFIDDGYRLDPAALVLAMALEARRWGAEIRTNTDVKQILVADGRVTGVATDQGIIWTETVIDAAGPWAAKLARGAGLDLPLTGARGWLLLTRKMPKLANHLLESSGWHLTAGDPGPAEVTVSGYGAGEHPAAPDVGMLIQQNATGHILLGGSRLASMQEDPEGPEVTREIAQRAAAALPALAEAPLTAVWSGVRPMSRDGLPLIGWAGPVEGLFIAGGHGGQGVMLGGGTGVLAAQMILRSAPFTDPSPFDPARAI